MGSTIFVKRRPITLTMLIIFFAFSAHATGVQQLQPTAWDGGINGVLLVGKFRSQQDLNGMSFEGQRNTLITELVGRTKGTLAYYQALNDADLAGAGALLVYLRGTGSRNDQQIKTMTADDMRNTVIVEVGAQTRRGRSELQALSNITLVKWVLKRPTQFSTPQFNCAHCNDGSCQCGPGTGDELCAAHKGNDPTIGCSQQQ